MLSTKYLIFLQPRGNAEQMNLNVKVDSAFIKTGNVISSVTVPMEATRKAVLKKNAPRTD